MRRKLSGTPVKAGFICILCFALWGAAFTKEYHTNTELEKGFKTIEKKYPGLVHVSDLGKTAHNRPIILVRVGRGTPAELDTRTGILVIGSVRGDHIAGSEVCVGIVENLASQFKTADSIQTMLNRHVVYVIPRLNPEGAEFWFEQPLREHRGNRTPDDRDHDGLFDEDGPEDLNEDGLITMMRIKDPEGEYIPDPDDPELMRKADPVRGEKGIYRMYVEGVDNDNDGLYNEDGTGGVNIDSNFPHDYPAFTQGAGPYMLSEPESRALAGFITARRNICAVLVYGPGDNLVNPPSPPQNKKQEKQEGRRRFSKPVMSVHADDVQYIKETGGLYKTIMDLPATAKPAFSGWSSRGGVCEWLYFQHGVFSFTTSLITVPDADSSFHDRKNSSSKSGPGKKIDTMDDDRRWLSYFKKNQTGGFVQWSQNDHPQLGTVEVGGFAPLARARISRDEIDRLGHKQARFISALLARLPRIGLTDLKIEKRGDKVYYVSCTVQNNGYLPTATAHGADTRLCRPVYAKISLKNGRVLSGEPRVFIPRLKGSGGSKKIEWMITAEPGTHGSVLIDSERAGSVVRSIVIK